MNIFEKLKLMRKINGYTQQEIADKFLISRQAVQKWECGDTTPDIYKLKDISMIYNISLDDLLDPHIDEKSFRNLIINGSNTLQYNSYNKLVSLISHPNRIDYAIIAIITLSTSLFLVFLHVIGVIIVILTIISATTALFLGMYFILNTYYNITNGFPVFLISIGASILSFSLSVYVYHLFSVILKAYTRIIKSSTNRIKDYSIIRKGINDARKS